MGNQDLLLLEVLPARGTLEWPVLGMGGLVEPELGPVEEDLPTLAAAVGLILDVYPPVGDEGDLLVETSPADGTGEGPLLTLESEGNWGWRWLVLPCVDPLVGGKGDLLGEDSAAGSTGEGALASVGAAVDDDTGLVNEGFGAVSAEEGTLPSVDAVVDCQLGPLGKALPTLVAREGLLTNGKLPTGDSRALLIFASHLGIGVDIGIGVGLDTGIGVGIGIGIAIGISVSIGAGGGTDVFAASLVPAMLMDAVVLDQGDLLAETLTEGQVTGVDVPVDGEA